MHPADIAMYSKLQVLLGDWLNNETFPEGHFMTPIRKANAVNAIALQLTKSVAATLAAMEETYLAKEVSP